MMPLTCTHAQALPEILNTCSAMRLVGEGCSGERQLTLPKKEKSC